MFDPVGGEARHNNNAKNVVSNREDEPEMNANISFQSSALCHNRPSLPLSPLMTWGASLEARPMMSAESYLENSSLARRRKRLMMLMALSLMFATAVPVLVLAGQ